MKIQLDDELVRSLKVVKVFREDPDKIKAIDYSPNGEQLISCSEDDKVVIYDCENGIQTNILNSKKYGVDLIHFTHEQNAAIHSSTKVDDKIRYLNLTHNKYLQYFAGHVKKVISLCMSPTENAFLSSALDKTLKIWDLRLPDSQRTLYLTGRPIAAYDPDGIIFAIGINSECIKLYDVRMCGNPFATFKLNREKECDWTELKFSKDGKTILISTNGTITRLIDAFHGTPLQTLTGNANFTLSMLPLELVINANLIGYLNNDRKKIESSFSPDSRFIFSGSTDGLVHVWNAVTGYKICVLNGGHLNPVQCVQFNPKYVMLSSACTDMAIWLPMINCLEEFDEW